LDKRRNHLGELGMKKKMQSEQEKERYRLWVEYLKESDAYALTCDYLADRLDLKDYGKTVRRYDNIHLELSRNEVIAYLKEDVNEFSYLYGFFGDIHDPSYSFDDWWKDEYKKRKERYEQKGCAEIAEARTEWSLGIESKDKSPTMIDLFIGSLRKTCSGGQPTYDQIEKLAIDFWGSNKWRTILIFHNSFPTKDIVKRVVDLVHEVKARYKFSPEEEDEMVQMYKPTPVGKRISSELEIYLEVYRMHEDKMKWKNIILTLAPLYIDENGKIDENGRRIFQGYLSKAKRIIENVENGVFPGKY
jgi:hypothetical protein